MYAFYNAFKADELWKELEEKSIAHKVIVTAYRDCRHKFFSDSVSECQLSAYEYGLLRGFKSEVDQVISETIQLSDKISHKTKISSSWGGQKAIATNPL